MAIESTLLQLILHAPDFVEGVTNLIKAFMLEGDTGEDTTDDLTLDEVAKEVALIIQDDLLERGNKIEKSILSKVQSMLDRGFSKMEARLAEAGPIVQLPSSPESQEEDVPQEEPASDGNRKVKIGRTGRRSTKRR